MSDEEDTKQYDAAIGANSVVVKDVDDGAAVAGIPARPMKQKKA